MSEIISDITMTYTQYLILFTILNTALFLYLLSDSKNVIKTRTPMPILILVLNVTLFFYLASQSFLLQAPYIYLGLIGVLISTLVYVLTYSVVKHSNTMKLRRSILYLNIFMVVVVFVFEYSLSIANGFNEVGEQAPDASLYFAYNHWVSSLKNPYYDIINVASFWIAILHKVLGVNDIIFALPNSMIYLTIAFLISLSAYIVYKKAGYQDLIIPAMLVAFATPYITFISVPPALSAMFAMLVFALVLGRSIRSSDYVVVTLLSITGMLAHATFISMIVFGLIALLMLSKIQRDTMESTYLRMLMLFLVIHVILSFVRLMYTTAYISFYPYYADFLRFLNFLSQPGGVELRVTRYEQWSPIFTSFSWTIYPAIATSYILTMIFKRRYSYNELFALSLSLAGLALIFIGFIGSYFSNSFSRQAAYSGYMLLFLGSFDALRRINHSKIGTVIMVIIVVMAIFSGLFTIKNASWLYVGKVPYLTYRPPTTPDITLAEDLLKLSALGELGIFRIYQDFDPGVYLVRLLEWGLIEPSNTLLPAIDVRPISTLGNVNDEEVIFNSRSLHVLRGGR